MTNNEAFLNNFYYLSDVYFKHPSDDFGAFLGAIDPTIWKKFCPTDKWFLKEWYIIFESYKGEDKTLFFTALPLYIKNVDKEMNYHITDILNTLNQQSEFKTWLSYKSITEETCKKHQDDISKWNELALT